MNIKLYKTSSTENTADKVLTNELTVSCNIKGTLNMINPVLTLNYNEAYLGYNYAYIPLFDRYYFLSPPDVTIGHEIIVKAREDYLSSHKANIRASEGRITRSKNMGDKYMVDSMVTLDDAYDIQCRKLGAGFTAADNYILVVGGSN